MKTTCRLCKTCTHWNILNCKCDFSKHVIHSEVHCVGYKYRPYSTSTGYFEELEEEFIDGRAE